jgi:hypothetical protein
MTDAMELLQGVRVPQVKTTELEDAAVQFLWVVAVKSL